MEYGIWIRLNVFACEEHTSFQLTFTSFSFFFWGGFFFLFVSLLIITYASIPGSLAFPFGGCASLDKLKLQYWKHIFACFRMLSRMCDVRMKWEKENIASHERFMNKMPGALADDYIHMKWEWESPGVKIQRTRKIYKNTDTYYIYSIQFVRESFVN